MRAPIGVIIHPSAYMIYDQNPFVVAQAKRWPSLEQFSRFRQQALPDAQFTAWGQIPAIGGQEDAKFRILVCGDAGVGKSTLINMLFGVSGIVCQCCTRLMRHTDTLNAIDTGKSR